jgi:hypothetical protein
MACYAAQLEETLLFSNKTFNSPRLTYNTACNSYSLAIISFFGDKHNYAPHIVSGTSEWSFCFDTGKRRSTTEFKCVKRECNETEGLAFVFGCKRKARESNGKLRGFGQGDSRKRFKSWIAANRCVRGSQTPQMPLADNGGFVDIDQYPLPTILTRPTSMPNGPGSSAETSYSEGKIARLQNISMLTYTDGITAHVMYQAGRDMETQEEAIDSVTDSDSRLEEPQRENTPFPGHSIDKYAGGFQCCFGIRVGQWLKQRQSFHNRTFRVQSFRCEWFPEFKILSLVRTISNASSSHCYGHEYW